MSGEIWGVVPNLRVVVIVRLESPACVKSWLPFPGFVVMLNVDIHNLLPRHHLCLIAGLVCSLLISSSSIVRGSDWLSLPSSAEAEGTTGSVLSELEFLSQSLITSQEVSLDPEFFSRFDKLPLVRAQEEREGEVDVPEPLLFDMVRPLGARKGELEFNTLAVFPFLSRNRNNGDDAFGPSAVAGDRRGIDWAPEVEYAPVDNFAIEFEFPFEEHEFESYKLGLQWTIGTAFNDSYIHGFQMLIEPTVHWRQWNTTLIYIGGLRFDDTWSALFMVGGRMDVEGPRADESFDYLFNASLFADISPILKFGLETNYASNVLGGNQFIAVPQLHLAMGKHIEVQTGIGIGVFDDGYEHSYILRAIWSN